MTPAAETQFLPYFKYVDTTDFKVTGTCLENIVFQKVGNLHPDREKIYSQDLKSKIVILIERRNFEVT